MPASVESYMQYVSLVWRRGGELFHCTVAKGERKKTVLTPDCGDAD